MNREIKFRGLESYTNTVKEWKFGYLRKPYEIQGIEPSDIDEVDWETVGQFTGLKDKNGVEIYEDDIIQIRGYKERVVYSEGGFAPFSIHGWEVTPKWSECEVIGNIHQNKDLLNE